MFFSIQWGFWQEYRLQFKIEAQQTILKICFNVNATKGFITTNRILHKNWEHKMNTTQSCSIWLTLLGSHHGHLHGGPHWWGGRWRICNQPHFLERYTVGFGTVDSTVTLELGLHYIYVNMECTGPYISYSFPPFTFINGT